MGVVSGPKEWKDERVVRLFYSGHDEVLRDSEVREMPKMKNCFGYFSRKNTDSDGLQQMDTWVVDVRQHEVVVLLRTVVGPTPLPHARGILPCSALH